MTNRPDITAELLKNAISESSIQALRGFAKACGVVYQQQWSGLDLVVHARRWATYQQQGAVVAAIDRGISELWANIAVQLCDTRARTGAADPELMSGSWVRSLKLLTERFPSSVVHDAFVFAMLAVARQIGSPSLSQRATISGFRARVEAEAKLFTPVLLRTINRSTPERLQEIFRDCGMMFYPGDYFSGYLMAWRYGSDVAVRYAQALSHSLPRSMFNALPLGSEKQMDELKIIIIAAMSSARTGLLGAAADPIDLFEGLRGPLSAWAEWLAEVFRDSPTLLVAAQLDQNPMNDENSFVDFTDILTDEDPIWCASMASQELPNAVSL